MLFYILCFIIRWGAKAVARDDVQRFASSLKYKQLAVVIDNSHVCMLVFSLILVLNMFYFGLCVFSFLCVCVFVRQELVNTAMVLEMGVAANQERLSLNSRAGALAIHTSQTYTYIQ